MDEIEGIEGESRSRKSTAVSPRHSWLRWVQIAVTAALMVVLLRQMTWDEFASTVSGLDWGMTFLALGAFGVSHLINVFRWYYLLDCHAAKFGALLSFYGAGLFSNNFLPTGIGGDGVRGLLLSQKVPAGHAFFSVALDRGVGLLTLSFLLLIGVWLGVPTGLVLTLPWQIVPETAFKIGIAVSLGGLLLLGLAWLRFNDLHRYLLERIQHLRALWQIPAWSLQEGLLRILVGYLISIPSQVLIVVAAWATLRALGIIVPPAAALWLVLLSSLSLLLPISVNGLGVVEGLYVIVLETYGVPAVSGLATAFLGRILGVSLSLLGGLLSLKYSAFGPREDRE